MVGFLLYVHMRAVYKRSPYANLRLDGKVIVLKKRFSQKEVKRKIVKQKRCVSKPLEMN
jgi:hypothetical protein